MIFSQIKKTFATIQSYSVIVVFIIWLGIQSFWFCTLDLSDLPGAGGTMSMFKALQQDWQAHPFSIWLSYMPQYNLESKAIFYSIAGSFLGFVGLLLCGWSLGRSKGLIGCGLLGSTWTVIHEYGIHVGPDSWTFGLSWFSIGLCWYAMQQRNLFWCSLCVFASGYLLKLAIHIKFLAIPVLCFVPMAIFTIRKWTYWHIFHIVMLSIVIIICFPQMNGSTTLQGNLRIPEIDWLPISMGWFKLNMLYTLGQPYGKFDQFLIGAVVTAIFVTWFQHQQKATKSHIILLTLASSLVLCVSAFILEDRIQIRLLTSASLGIMAISGYGIGILFQSKKIKFVFLGLFIPFLLLMDNWAYVHHYGQLRAQWTGSTNHSIAAPQIWQTQYKANNTLFKSTSLYGSIAIRNTFIKSIQQVFSTNSIVLYTMRLRDGRETNLLLYSHLENHQSQVLDIQKCCPIAQGNLKTCANRIVQHVETYGGFLVVPKGDPWDRVHHNEQNWKGYLQKSIQKSSFVSEDPYWMWLFVPPKDQKKPIFFCKN